MRECRGSLIPVCSELALECPAKDERGEEGIVVLLCARRRNDATLVRPEGGSVGHVSTRMSALEYACRAYQVKV